PHDLPHTLSRPIMPHYGQDASTLTTFTSIATYPQPPNTCPTRRSSDLATINWGDTTTSTGTIVSLGGGNYRVDAPAHTYVEEGTYTVNVTLKHDALPAVTTPNQTISVADQQITNLTAANLPATGNENASIGAVTGIATFTDPAGVRHDTPAVSTARFSDRDTTTSTGTVVSLGGGNYRVDAPAHTYVEEGT